MVQDLTVEQLSLVGLSYHCDIQTKRFWKRLASDSRFCFELFRRALSDPHSDTGKAAWGFIHQQYARQAMLWVKRHRSFPMTGREPDLLADLALEKMWVSFANKNGKLRDFPDDPERGLKALMKFLQLCIHSVVMDNIERYEAELPSGDDGDSASEPATEDPDRLASEAIWRCVFDRLKTDKERLVVDGSFVNGLKPGQIYKLHADVFKNTKEVYRIKENVLARLRRDRTLRDCFS